jgi:hypothetical protein
LLDTREFIGSFSMKRDRILIVKYVSLGSGPCHTLKPMLNKVVDSLTTKITLSSLTLSKTRILQSKLVWQEPWIKAKIMGSKAVAGTRTAITAMRSPHQYVGSAQDVMMEK